MEVDRKELALIKEVLRSNPRGMTVTEISKEIKMNRHSVAKYLEILAVSGHIDMKSFGPSKVYYISQRLPISAMLSFSSAFIIILDKDLRIVNVNEKFLEFTDLDRADIIHKNLENFSFPLEFEPSIIPSVILALDGKESTIEAIYHKRKAEVFFFIKFIPTVFDDGEKGITIIFENITERKQSEKSIRESEQKFRSVIEQSLDGVILTDNNGRIIEFNRISETITGLQRDQVVGKTLWDAGFNGNAITEPHTNLKNVLITFKNIINSYMKTNKVPINDPIIELDLKNAHGDVITVQITYFLIVSGNDRMLCIMIRDITSKKKIEREIIESEQKFRGIIEQSTDGFVLTDEEGRIIEFNKSMEKISGYAREDNMGRFLWDSEFFTKSIPSADRKIHVHIKEQMKKYLKTGSSPIASRIIESDVKRKDGTLCTLQFVVFPIKTEKGYKISGIARDITERKKMENELKESEEKFRSLAETTTNGILILQGGSVIYNNPAVEIITGYTIADVSGRSMFWMVDRDYADFVTEAENDFLQGNIPNTDGRNELKLQNKRGDLIWIEFTIGKLNYLGKPSIIITFFDVTARKTMEEELKKAHDDLEQRVMERTHELELANKSLHSEIEQRILSENALRNSENKYKYLVENINDIICEIGQDMRFIYISPRVRDVLGYEPVELLGKTPYEVMREEEQKRIINIFENNIRNNEPQIPTEIFLTHKDGGQTPVELSVRQIVDGAGNTIGYNAIVRDLTQRKIAEEKLLQSTTDLQAIFKAFPDLFFRIDADGTILGFNGPLLYLGPDDLLGKKMQDIMPPAYRSISDESIRSVSENKLMVIFEYVLSVNGKNESFEARLLPTFSNQILMIVRNITERKAIENELRGSEEKFRNLVEKLDDLVWEIDEKLVFTYLSPRIKDLLGYSPSEVIGRNVLEFMSDDEARRVSNKVRPFIENNQPFDVFENILIHKDGREVIMEVSGAPIFGSNGALKGYRGVDRDVTGKRKAEEMLRWSVAFMRATADNSPLAIYAVDSRNDQILYYNKRFIEIANLTEIEERIARREIKHSDIISYILPKIKNSYEFLKIYERLNDEVNKEIADEEIINKEGRYIRCFSTQIRDDNDSYLGRLYILEDITERKRDENALWENQRFLDTLIGNLPGMVYRCYNDNDWTMDYASEGCLDLTGYDPDDLVTNNRITYENIVHSGDRERVRKEVGSALSRGMPFTIEYRIVTASGETKWVWEQGCESSPLSSGERMIEGFVTDITQRKLFEENISSLASFPELDPNPVIEVNGKEQIIYMNKSAKETFPGLAPGHPIVAGLKPIYHEFRNGGLKSYSREIKFDATTYSQFIYYVPKQDMLRIYAADITKRKQAEDELKIVNRALRMINDCNQTLVRAVNEKQLLEDICRIIVEKGGYRLAWVGLISKDRPDIVVPSVKMGFDNGYVDNINIDLSDVERGSGPTGTSIKSGQPTIARYTATDPSFTPWREEALKRGYASTVSLPLRSKGSPIGCLCIYSTKADAFDPDELKLLTELADDLTYGLMSLRAEAEHEKAEDMLYMMKSTIESMNDAALWIGEDSHFYYVNAAACDSLGYTREEMLQMGIADIDPTFDKEGWAGRWKQMKNIGHSQITAVQRKKDGSLIPVVISSNYMEFKGKQYDFAFSRPITDKTVEEVLRIIEKNGAYDSEFDRQHKKKKKSSPK